MAMKNKSGVILFSLFSGLIIIMLTNFSYSRNAVWKDEISVYEKAINKSLKARPYMALGKAYISKGFYSQAFAAFEAASQLNTSYVDAALLELCMLSESMGNLDDAVYYCELTLQPGSAFKAPAHEHIAYIFFLRSDFSQAIAHLEAAIKISPTDKNYYNLGLAFEKNGNMKSAIVQYKKAIEVNAAHVDAHLNLANIYLQLGMTMEARRTYESAQKINLYDERIQNNLGFLQGKSGGQIEAELGSRKTRHRIYR